MKNILLGLVLVGTGLRAFGMNGAYGLEPGISRTANQERYKSHQVARTTQVAEPNAIVLSGDIIIPQVVDGAGWKTTFKLVNLNSARVTFQLLFFTDLGTDMSLPISATVGTSGTYTGLTITLNSEGSVDIETAGTNAALSQGWAILLLENVTDSVGGFAIFRQRVPGIADQEATVPFSNATTGRFLLIYDNTAYVTALAIANASDVDVVVPVNIRDLNSDIIATSSVTLGPFGHLASVLSPSWTVTAGQQGSIEFLGGSGVAALGLRFNGAAFTSFPTMSNAAWIGQ